MSLTMLMLIDFLERIYLQWEFEYPFRFGLVTSKRSEERLGLMIYLCKSQSISELSMEKV